MDGITAWHKAAENGWCDSWHAKLTATLASRHSAEKRNPEDSLAAHTVPHRDAESRRKDKRRYTVGVFWIPRLGAELKVAVKAMTT